jgi:hypothetical protein
MDNQIHLSQRVFSWPSFGQRFALLVWTKVCDLRMNIATVRLCTMSRPRESEFYQLKNLSGYGEADRSMPDTKC